MLDEVHHLPALSDMAPDPLAAGWSHALLPLLETARLRLLLSGTLQRADGHSILWLPYRTGTGTGTRARTREVDLSAPGWAMVGYSRAQALAERAVLPVLFGAVDGEASWLDEARTPTRPHRLASPWPTETIVPLESNALGLRYGLLRPGPDFIVHCPEQAAAQTEMLDPPSVLERRLRQRIGEMVAQQAVEDEGVAQAPRRGAVSTAIMPS